LPVSVERPGSCDPAARTNSSTARTIRSAAYASAAYASAAVKGVSVIKRSAPGEVPAAAKHGVSAAPIESPMTPAPAKTSEPTDSEAEPERKIRAAKPDSGIRIPTGPCVYGISVNQPRIVRRDINHIRVGRLNINIRAFLLNDFVLRVLESAGLLRFMAHHLYRVHDIGLLIVISVAKS
jgi:hypothetical protein